MMKKVLALFTLILFVTAPVFAQKYASVNAKRANIRACAGTKCAIKWYAWRYTPLIIPCLLLMAIILSCGNRVLTSLSCTMLTGQ